MMTRVQILLALILGVSTASALPAEHVSAVRPGISLGDDGSYHLDGGDRIRVTVFGEDTLGGEFLIGNSGQVALPLIGEIGAAGLTPTELQTRIAAALANGVLKSPKVSIEVLNYRPFYILGEVNKPGEYSFAKGMTVLNAVAKAEGFTYRASTRKVSIRHAGQTTEIRERLDVGTIVHPGDTVRISERWF